jgi:uncharacterized protein YdaL
MPVMSTMLRAALLLLLAGRAAALDVCVYHDAGDDGDGQLHAIMLANLLGHFKEARAVLRPLQAYKPGELAACDRAAYVGTVWEAKRPPAFLRELAGYRRPFLLVNYGADALQNAMGPERFLAKAGFLYRRISDIPRVSAEGVPGFFRDVDYKGARFSKKVQRAKDGRLIGSGEMNLVDAADARVLAVARHSDGRQSTPYALRKGAFFYVADDPFLYIHEQDRYLVLADLLFDFLGLPPREHGRPALVRLEDVHPDYDLRLFYRAVKTLKRRHVPFAVSVIPKFVPKGKPESAGRDMNSRRAFLRALRYAQASGGTLLIHGWTHHVADAEGCPSLGSAADYEFWDRCGNRPLPYDSDAFLRGRIAAAKAAFAEAGLRAAAWVTPHYAASPRDFRLFGALFERTLQRVCYYPDGKEGPPAPYVTQFFPYTIYKDHYGQFVWPEDLGFVPMPGSDWGYDTPGDVGEAARRAAVVRDAWASFFWHPQLAATDGGIARLEELVDTIRSRGFIFVSLDQRLARGE